MNTVRCLILSILCASSIPSIGWTASAQPAKDNPDAVFALVRIDRTGQLQDADALKDLRQGLEKEKPTHVFLLAHGWNNSEQRARVSYEDMIKLMRAQIVEQKLNAAEFRPVFIGIHWPSLAWDGDEGTAREFLNRHLSEDLRRKLKFALLPTKFRGVELEELFDGKLSATTVLKLFPIIRPFLERGLKLEGGEGLALSELDEDEVDTLFKAVRVFSYWQMKKRAGAVGVRGGLDVLREVQAACPQARTHLVGHSFGCTFWLAALDERARDEKPVDSLVLLQGAVSSLAFAEKISLKDDQQVKGGFHRVMAERRVKGPIVAVFSDHDWPVRNTFPLASRAAGQVAEQSVRARTEANKAYRALGAWGIDGVEARPMLPVGQKYAFKESQLHSIDGTKFILSHPAIEKPPVAWLIWAAALGR